MLRNDLSCVLGRTPPGVRELKRRHGSYPRHPIGRTPPGVRELKPSSST